jgi:predicted nucleic acid-binding protein
VASELQCFKGCCERVGFPESFHGLRRRISAEGIAQDLSCVRGRLSLTEVVSASVMRIYGVRQIFSHDRDFDKVKGVRRAETLPSH